MDRESASGRDRLSRRSPLSSCYTRPVEVDVPNMTITADEEVLRWARVRAARENTSDLETRVARDVRVAYLNGKTSYDRLSLTDQMLKQAQSALDLAQSRYNLGLSSMVELSQAQLSLTSAQIAAASARYDWQAQRLNVDFQAGRLK